MKLACLPWDYSKTHKTVTLHIENITNYYEYIRYPPPPKLTPLCSSSYDRIYLAFGRVAAVSHTCSGTRHTGLKAYRFYIKQHTYSLYIGNIFSSLYSSESVRGISSHILWSPHIGANSSCDTLPLGHLSSWLADIWPVHHHDWPAHHARQD